ncbi:helix-turn-helix domain-containing protein [Paraburkholderia sp.]|uniref:helix-turn-helix domain-containing protein n=1 Tax=Paraburkholderia sp. TaxID=1926495 RepID=UPI002384808D|nr:helix-turn-helix domain-containing protein [Paraburkholderia sp.]MDE1179369.1 helix-turn-helix domain-containing protein [Paraburkholderia sp.]
MSAPTIVVTAFDQISPFHLSVPCLVFGDTHPDLPRFAFKVCAVEPGPITTTAGFSLGITHGLSALKKADTIIVPSWRDAAERPPEALLKALIAAHRRGAQIVGLCLGAYVLAEAGLLDGRQATTHWAYAEDFATRFPAVKVNADALYMEDGNVMTSAGTAAGIDCCLHMIRQRYGAEPANRLARRLVVSPHRRGGQAQFVEHPMPATARESRLSALMDDLRSRLGDAHTLDSLANQALMSRRTFTRQFQQVTGTTFGKWLLNERLALTQRLLETTDHPVDTVSRLAGFGSSESLRVHFRRAFGIAPTAWRQGFKGRTV